MKVRTGFKAGQGMDATGDCADLLDRCKKQLREIEATQAERAKHETIKTTISNLRV
jgi:hypothetical protein